MLFHSVASLSHAVLDGSSSASFPSLAMHYIISNSPTFSSELTRGNVRAVEIDGPMVRLNVEGACGNCPPSTMKTNIGLELRLVQRIPEISEVV